MKKHQEIKDQVQRRYGKTALSVLQSGEGCCGPSPCPSADPISINLYAEGEEVLVPARALQASLGCGNPTALAMLEPGQVVLDLGSGGGIDVFLSARRVGPTGKVYGLDMTDEMLQLARENQREAGVENVEFLKGEMEAIPLPDNSVDVIISNCVVNLSTDKDRVFREAYRVLRPGGRLAISDIVVRGDVPVAIRSNLELWMGCVAGALQDSEYFKKLEAAGFEKVDVEPTRVYSVEDMGGFLKEQGIELESLVDEVDGKFVSAFIRARKPRL